MRDVLAIEVTAAAVRSLRLAGFGRTRGVRAYAERPLPPGLLIPSSSIPNIQDEPMFTRILADAAGPRPPRRIRLVVPDRTVRIQILNTDAQAPQGPDLRRFLVWRLRETLPFEAREARVAYMAAPNGLPTRLMAITLVAREQVVAQYERSVGLLGAAVAHMAPAACHLFNLAGLGAGGEAPGSHGFLVLGVESATFFLSRHGVPHYARTFPRPAASADSLPAAAGDPVTTAGAALVQEILRTIQHAADEAGLAPPERLLLAGEMGQDEGLAAALQRGLGFPCAVLSLPSSVRGAGRLPRHAHAVLAAALARL